MQVTMSRARERGNRTQTATGAPHAAVSTTGGGSLSRLRTRGAATPATSMAPAAARMRAGRRRKRASISAGAASVGCAAMEPAHRYETVTLYRRGGELRIELNRPDALNAWNVQFGHDMLDALEQARAD